MYLYLYPGRPDRCGIFAVMSSLVPQGDVHLVTLRMYYAIHDDEIGLSSGARSTCRAEHKILTI